MKSEIFNKNQIKIVCKSVEMAEDIINGYYKMSPGQWLRHRYEVKTYIDLNENEKVTGPFAQIVKYSGYRKDSSLGSENFDLYRICLQDSAVLNLINNRAEILIEPFLLYINVHELIHIVRFGQFEQFFHVNSSQRECEERLVHRVTHEVLKKKTVKGLEDVFAYYATAVS